MAKPKTAACAHCGKPVVAPYKPFCSRRSADVDLGRWLGGRYRIQTDDRPGADGLGDDDEAGES